jgi:hypothetical protein
MPKYVIKKADRPVALAGLVIGKAWQQANVLHIEDHPWHKGQSAYNRPTDVRVLWDDTNLYIQFICQDKHISSVETKLNGSVYLDSCAEFFAMVDPSAGMDYFNLEMNCCGTMHLGFGPGRGSRRLCTPEIAGQIKIVASVDGPTKQESPTDELWWLAAALPWTAIGQLAQKPIQPTTGTKWKANFYRCGGSENTYGVWSQIDTPAPDYHRPEYFGDIEFA